MGKGDKKSKRGKIWKDSYGNSRNKKAIKAKLKRSLTRKTTQAAAVTASASATTEEAVAKPKRTISKKKSDA
jgi:ribosomal small subunit protein bTHX